MIAHTSWSPDRQMPQADKSYRQRRGYSPKNDRLAPISLKVGSIMLTERDKSHWGWEIAKRVGTHPTIISQVLRGFEQRGWAECRHETINADVNYRPPRVLFCLTSIGVVAIRDALIPFQHPPVST